MTETTYNRLLQPHRRALARLRLDFQFFLEESGPLLIVSIEDRLKTFQSAMEKSQKMGIPVEQLNDLAGLRIVAGTSVDVDFVRHFFTNGLRGTSYTVVKDERVENKEGYRAHHIDLEIPEDYTGTWSKCRVEIQLQTALESAFNRLSRLWVYKSGRELPYQWEFRFAIMADNLQEVDKEAAALQRELFSATEGLRDDDPLSPLALHGLLKECFEETVTDDEAQWYNVYYRRTGAETCGQLRSFFLRSDISQLYDEWCEVIPPDSAFAFAANNKHTFWAMQGTRLDKTASILNEAKAKRASQG